MAENGDRDPVTGQFVKGSKGGPGRPAKRTALHNVVDEAATERLWRAELAAADGGDADARRFILGHKQGKPTQASPDTPRVDWPSVYSSDDLPAAVTALLMKHAEGEMDGAAFEFLTNVLGALAKIIEVGDQGVKLRKLEEHIAAQGGNL